MIKKGMATVFVAIFVCCSVIFCGCGNVTPASANIDSYAYYAEHLDQKIERIKNVQAEHDIAESFFFLTDLHWEANYKHSPYLVQIVKEETGIDKINFGGDYIAQDYEDTAEALYRMSECVHSFKAFEKYAILGNHELNTQHWRGTPEISSNDSNAVVNDGRFSTPYFYVENSDAKIVSIYLNSNDLSENKVQKSWFVNLITSYDEDWTALIFTHMFYSSVGDDGVRLHTAGALLNELIINSRGEIKCSIAGVFSGHIHTDHIEKIDNYYTATATTCDCAITYILSEYDRCYRTTSDQAFDVVQIDTSSKHVYLTRIGAGADREYTF